MTTQEPRAEGSTPPTVPNFREDERIQARYQSMLERRIKTFAVEHESLVRRNASTKRDELQEELEEANAEWNRRNEVAEATREAYRKAYPDHVKKTRLVEPTAVENMKSLGAAKKLYRAAEEAWRAAVNATSNVRRIEHNENQVDVELQKALERVPQVVKEVTESVPWIDDDQRLKVTELAPDFWRATAHYGFMERPDIPRLLLQTPAFGCALQLDDVTYYVGHETIVHAEDGSGMWHWEEQLYAAMARNALHVSDFLLLPTDSVVEIGRQIAI